MTKFFKSAFWFSYSIIWDSFKRSEILSDNQSFLWAIRFFLTIRDSFCDQKFFPTICISFSANNDFSHYFYLMLTQDEVKRLVAKQAAQLVQNNMTVGIGSGSTVYWLIMELGSRVKKGLFFRAIPTSKKRPRSVPNIIFRWPHWTTFLL